MDRQRRLRALADALDMIVGVRRGRTELCTRGWVVHSTVVSGPGWLPGRARCSVMTTSTTPPSTTIRLTEPSALIASIPALLGFVFTRSLVVFCMEGAAATRVGLVMRIDLPEPGLADPQCAAAMAEQLSVLCAQRKTPAVMAVVVEDRSTPAELPHRALLATVREAREAVGAPRCSMPTPSTA